MAKIYLKRVGVKINNCGECYFADKNCEKYFCTTIQDGIIKNYKYIQVPAPEETEK